MILYKGNTLVEGKHFMLEDEVLTYQGKVYGNYFLFKNSKDLDLVLDESDLGSLKLYEHSTVEESDEADDLTSLLVAYLNKGISIIDNGEDVVNKLITYFTEFKNHLDELGYTYTYSTTEIDKNTLIDFIKSYLEKSNINISSISMPNLYTTICSIIYNLYKLKEDGSNGNME